MVGRRLLEIARVFRAVVQAELVRTTLGPGDAIEAMRRRGRVRQRRYGKDLTFLRKVISVTDRVFPSGPNCYRRALTESFLDAGAAGSAVCFGFDTSLLGSRPGHAWLDNEAQADATLDVTFRL